MRGFPLDSQRHTRAAFSGSGQPKRAWYAAEQYPTSYDALSRCVLAGQRADDPHPLSAKTVTATIRLFERDDDDMGLAGVRHSPIARAK